MIKNITSSDNRIFKSVLKLQKRSVREAERLFVAEGARLVDDALKSGVVEFVVATNPIETDLPQYIVSDKLFARLSDTKNPQGIIAVCKMNDTEFAPQKYQFVVVCDGVSDPGNMGTIIRTAEAAGVDAVIMNGNCVDLYNPKVVRSTMGSLFRLPVFDDDELVLSLAESGFSLAVTTLDGSVDLYDADLTGKVAVVIGNEAHGVSQQLFDLASVRVRIPMCGQVESLNAAVAASVILYECKRQNR